MGFQCDKDEIEYKHNFVEQVNLFPAQKSYRVGDTIWLQYANPSRSLNDVKTSQRITADTVSIDFGLSFNIRYGVQFIPVDGLCDYITPNGLNIGRTLGPGNGTGFSYTFGCTGSSGYDFRIGIVPKQTGIYSLDLGNNGFVSSCANRTIGFPFSNIGYRFDLADCNKDVYLTIPQNARSESPRGSTEEKIDNKQVYVFRVD